MDNFLIFIIIACAILWWDSRKRNKATSKAWEDIGVKENTHLEFSTKRMPETTAMSPEELMEILNSWKETIPQKQTDDELIRKLVNDVLKEIPSEEMEDAKSALKSLGYKNKDIKKATNEIMNTMGNNMKSGEIVISALRILTA